MNIFNTFGSKEKVKNININESLDLKNINIEEYDRIKGSLLGFFVGDALGVPVEFVGRETLKSNPINDMEEYGTHYQAKGTWS